MSSLRQLKVTFDSFDDLVEVIGPGLSRIHLFAPTREEIPAGTRVRLEIGTVRKGALIRGVAKVAGPGDEAAAPGLHLHLIHLDPSSTRRVDSIVRGEVAAVAAREPGIPSPFDIPSAEPEPAPEPEPEAEPEPEPEPEAETEPEPEPEAEGRLPGAVVEPPPAPAAGGRLGRLVWPLVLAALAVAVLLVFERASRDGENPLLTGRDRQTAAGDPAAGDPAAGVADPGAESEPAEPAPEELPAAGELTAATGAGPAAGAADPEAVAAEVEQAVRAWAAAWSRQDPAAYLELYAPEYSPSGLARDAWERQRRARITAPESLEVSVGELEVEITGAGRARARFQQLYVTGEKALAARKTLELERFTPGWKIVAERVETQSRP